MPRRHYGWRNHDRPQDGASGDPDRPRTICVAARICSPSRSAARAEVLSDSTGRRDRGKKRDSYLRLGIPEYWIVDIGARAVTVVRPGLPDARLTGRLRWQPRAAIRALEIELDKIFP